MKIGVLIVCTGKYSIFFEKLYESAEKFFLTDHEKTYYVFTDKEIIEGENIRRVPQESLGWPYNTLKRFEMFNKVKDLLLKEDFLFFLNANMLFTDYVNDEIIPKEENDYLMGVSHPGFFNKKPEDFTYERRKESVFFIPTNQGKYYYQGCFNGGKSDKFLEMSELLDKMIDIDLAKEIIPVWWDESALNWYFLFRNPLLVHSGYAYPEGWKIPFDMKIMQRNKNNYGGYDFLRND